MDKKNFPDIEDDLAWSLITANEIIPEVWFRAEVDKDDETDRDKFKSQLESNTRIWRALRSILAQRYQSRKVPLNLTERNLTYRYIFNEGYRQALLDVYRLLPRTEIK